MIYTRLGIRRRGFEKMSQKYYLDYCDKKVINDKNTLDWLVAKNVTLSGKVVEGLLNNDMKVVIKLGTNKASIEKEYNISKELSVFPGFVRYICKFSCKDDLRKYPGTWKPDVGFCEIDGPDKTNSIIMPFYTLGSMLKYKWTKENFYTFKILTKIAVTSLLTANQEIGFIHNDFHLDNILIKQTKYGLTVDIIDFELSDISNNNKQDHKKLGMDLRKLFSDLFKLDCITDDSISFCIIFTSKMRDPFEAVHVTNVFDLIDNLEYVERP